MKLIENNITPVTFLERINQNLSELATIRGVPQYPEITPTDNYIDAINSAYESVIITAGMKGSEVITTINYELINMSGGVIDPILNSLTWLDDGVTLDISDINSGTVEYEVWENRNGEDFELLELVSDINAHCKIWQNCIAGVKVRSKKNGNYSGFSEPVYLDAPWVWYTDQSTLKTITIEFIQVAGTAGTKSIYIDFGDDDIIEVVSGVALSNYTKNYDNTGEYYIKITGDVDFLNIVEIYDTVWGAGTDVSKWNLREGFAFSHLYSNGYIGDISKLKYPSNCTGHHLGDNALQGDITNMQFPSLYWDLHIKSTTPELIIGDISDWVLPDRIAHFHVDGYVTGNLTNVIPFRSITYPNILVRMASIHPQGFTGNLNNWIIPDYTLGFGAAFYMHQGCNFTGMPRGHFNNMQIFNFANNNCSTSEIDNFLVYIDNYFTGGVVPLVSCAYTLTGVNMGTPTATGLAAKSSIESKYTAAGFTATIEVNS